MTARTCTLLALCAIALAPLPARMADIAGATNHVKVGLAQAMAGEALTTTTTRAYGCSIKYD